MVRVILFDFYSVWTPDRYQEYLNYAQANNAAQSYAELTTVLAEYYTGEVNLEYLADVLRLTFGHPEIDKDSLTLHASNIPPDMINLLRDLHGHFLKLGVFGNLGMMELGLLMGLNTDQPLLEFILSPLTLGIKMPLLSQPVFAKALQDIGEQPADCVVVSGHEDYLAFAAWYGMQTIRFTNFSEVRQILGTLIANDTPGSIPSKSTFN